MASKRSRKNIGGMSWSSKKSARRSFSRRSHEKSLALSQMDVDSSSGVSVGGIV